MFGEEEKEDIKEKIKKWTEDGNYNLLFHQGYGLGQVIRQVPWHYSYCVIDASEKVLLQASYRIICTDNCGGHGQELIHFYILEKGGRKYCKFVNAMPLATIPFYTDGSTNNARVKHRSDTTIPVFIPGFDMFTGNDCRF